MKGKGKGAPPPPPPPSSGPKAKPPGYGKDPEPGTEGLCGMSQLLAKVKSDGEAMDQDHSLEIEGVDLSGIDASAQGERSKCPRCEKMVLTDFLEEHQNSHSAEIHPWLFLGGKRNAENDQELTVRTQITHILNVAGNECHMPYWIWDEWTRYNKEELGTEHSYKKMNWTDTADQDILTPINEAMEFIHEAHTSSASNHVLVHCIQGISRSSSVILAYLMRHEGMSLRAAYDHCKKVRPIMEPRPDFLDQLGAFECKLFELAEPTLTSKEAFAGKTLLDLDNMGPVAQQSA